MSQKAHPLRNIPLSKLGINPFVPGGHADTAASGDSQSNSHSALEGDSTGDPFTREIYRRIDLALDYPDELIRAGTSGEVDLEFQVDAHGVLQGLFEDVRTNERILKVHVFHAIRKALSEPMSNLLYSRPHLRVRAHFDFKIVTDPGNLPPEHEGIAPSGFLFSRNSVNTRRSDLPSVTSQSRSTGATGDRSEQVSRNWKIDQDGILNATSNGGAPGVGFNPLPLIQKLFDWNKAKPDPLEKYRDDPDY